MGARTSYGPRAPTGLMRRASCGSGSLSIELALNRLEVLDYRHTSQVISVLPDAEIAGAVSLALRHVGEAMFYANASAAAREGAS